MEYKNIDGRNRIQLELNIICGYQIWANSSNCEYIVINSSSLYFYALLYTYYNTRISDKNWIQFEIKYNFWISNLSKFFELWIYCYKFVKNLYIYALLPHIITLISVTCRPKIHYFLVFMKVYNMDQQLSYI